MSDSPKKRGNKLADGWPKTSPPMKMPSICLEGWSWQWSDLPPIKFVCGHCNATTAANNGVAYCDEAHCIADYYVYFCTHCCRPTYFENRIPLPAPAPVGPVRHLSDEVEAIYEQSRAAYRENAFTLVVMGCRAILMHVAVEKNAPEGKPFALYVDYLKDQGYISTASKDWVDRIRQLGNEANHKIELQGQSDALIALRFTHMLLTIIYEFPQQMALEDEENQ